jgi:Family of unknown function (DUF6384)
MAEGVGASTKPQTLDDLMMAMDVVDTIRHREKLIERELNEEGREAELIGRLREIYRQQGIEVSDRVLADGVNALRESRFVYTPPPPGWTRTLFTLWVRRGQLGRYATIVAAAIVLAWAAYYFGVARPARLAEEQAQIELQQTLPNAIRKAHADIAAIATDPAAKERADQLLADGERAIRDGDRAAMQKVTADLEGLKDRVSSDYILTIVSRPGEPTGVWRRPPRGIQARNYYLIVEAIAPGGQKLKLPVRNEETGAIETVDKFGVRVTEQVYNAVAQDKGDDGIVQNNQFGVKKRGSLTVDYKMPFEGGMITQW